MGHSNQEACILQSARLQLVMSRRVSIGTERNARAFLRRFGRDVLVLDDSDPETRKIRGIWKRRVNNQEEIKILGDNFSERVYNYRLWIPAIFRGNFPGEITRRVVIDPETSKAYEFYVVDYQTDSDDWIEAILSPVGFYTE